MNASTVICWMSSFVILEGSGIICRFSIFHGKSCQQNIVDPNKTPHYVASDLGLKCLPVLPDLSLHCLPKYPS